MNRRIRRKEHGLHMRAFACIVYGMEGRKTKACRVRRIVVFVFWSVSWASRHDGRVSQKVNLRW